MPDSVKLFEPLQLGPLTVRNRAWVSPMCQYSCEQRDGVVGDWHLVHYGSFAIGGFGLIVAEATGVSPEARISLWDAGLWDDSQVDAWKRVTDFVHQQGSAMGVQLGHAGRKASTNKWWPGHEPRNILPDEGGWAPVGPTSAKGIGEEYTVEVTELDETGIRKVITDFAAAAERAARAGFDLVEIHAAHGYLLHQFYSPLSNTRTDGWGGSWENRTRLLLEVVDAVREVWQGALTVRISATDWREDGWGVEDSIALARLLAEHGVHLVDVSTGGNAAARIPAGPGYQVPFSEQVRAGAGVLTSSVGIIVSPEQAEEILQQGRADAVMLGREALRDPNWPLRAATVLGYGAEKAGIRPARARGVWRA